MKLSVWGVTIPALIDKSRLFVCVDGFKYKLTNSNKTASGEYIGVYLRGYTSSEFIKRK